MQYLIFIRRLLAIIILYSATSAYGQGSSGASVTSPYDSIAIVNAKAIGHPSARTVDLTVVLQNNYHRTAQLSFGSGVYTDFGFVDDQGSRYCLFHSERLQSNAATNQGYSPVTSLQFGSSKRTIINTVRDTISAGGAKTLHIQLGHVNKQVRKLQEGHLFSTLELGYLMAGQKQFLLKNLIIDWTPSH